MAQPNLIEVLDQAVSALQVARKALIANAKQEARSTKFTSGTKKLGSKNGAPKKGMSEEGRLRIAEAQRKRWAVLKRAAKKAARLAAK